MRKTNEFRSDIIVARCAERRYHGIFKLMRRRWVSRGYRMVKPKIDASEVLKDIRAGASHFRLMNKYHLSARGLNSLFKKLLDAGVVKQGDLGPTYKKEIRASEVIRDIRSGMSKSDFMSKHRISPTGLDSLFKKLVAAGAMTESELEQWLASCDQLDRWLSLLESAPDTDD